MNKKENYNPPDQNDARQRKIKRIYLVTATTAALAFTAIGAILLGFGIVQIGLALKSHDAGQRAQGFMTFFGGVIIYFAKDILDMIL